jgi:hypothetical protein
MNEPANECIKDLTANKSPHPFLHRNISPSMSSTEKAHHKKRRIANLKQKQGKTNRGIREEFNFLGC